MHYAATSSCHTETAITGVTDVLWEREVVHFVNQVGVYQKINFSDISPQFIRFYTNFHSLTPIQAQNHADHRHVIIEACVASTGHVTLLSWPPGQ